MQHVVYLAALLALGCGSDLKKKNSVNLTVYYESYCPASIDFITRKLHQTWHEHKDLINVDMVPYGNAQQSYNGTTDTFNFTCQHGPKECEGNILHACAIDQACGAGGTPNCPAAMLAQAMDYITCVMKKDDQREASDECATQTGLVSKTINSCAGGKQGERLLYRYGEQTASDPTQQYVPYIVLNNLHTEETQDAAQANLKKLLCQQYIKCLTSSDDLRT